jgi:hypothetical protein
MDRSLLSPDSGTNGRSPHVSSTAFRTQPPDLQPVPLMDMGFAMHCPLARHPMPQIRFLYIGSHVFCSTLLSDPTSRRRPCPSLLLHLHQVVEGTYTPELSNMLGTQLRRAVRPDGPFKPGDIPSLLFETDGELQHCSGVWICYSVRSVSDRNF